jgi:hypothetical protein
MINKLASSYKNTAPPISVRSLSFYIRFNCNRAKWKTCTREIFANKRYYCSIYLSSTPTDACRFVIFKSWRSVARFAGFGFYVDRTPGLHPGLYAVAGFTG